MAAQVISIKDHRDTKRKQAAKITKSGRTVSDQAAAAKLIRKELKAAWPSVTFRVTSSSFAGGDAVDIEWTDGPTSHSVENITRKYQYGSFDGMQDLYEYSNSRHDIPQAKYVQTRRIYSDETRREVITYLNQRYGYSLRLIERNGYIQVDPVSDELTPGGWASQQEHRVRHPQPFICDACQSPAHMGDDYCAECGERLTDEAYS